MNDIRIAEVMRTDIPLLAPETPIRRAVALLVEAGAAAAAVAGDDGRLCGILTQKDCFRPALHASYYREWTGTVAGRMTPEVFAVEASDSLIHVAEMFLHHPHRIFPVLESGRILGMVDRSDVLARLVSLG